MTTNEQAGAGIPVSSYRSVGLAALLRESVAGHDLSDFGDHLVRYASQCDDAEAWLDLSLVLQMKFEKELAMAAQARALEMRRLYRIQDGPREGAGVRILALKAPGDLMANTPFECLTEGTDLQVDALYVDASTPLELPDHDVLLVACCVNDHTRAILERLERELDAWPRPVLNHPGHIRCTEREAAYRLLHSVDGIAMAATTRIARAEAQAWTGARTADADGPGPAGPFIIRPLNSHAGQGLERIDSDGELAAYLERTDADVDGFYVAPFIDYSDDQGLYRKYRIVVIEGRPFLCHMGISQHWMVHYPYAEMIEHPGRREEEARAMATFDTDFAIRHGATLRAMSERIGLDYWGMDCAETRDGRLLVFEIATGMIIHDMDDPDVFPYKAEQIGRVRRAFHAMLTHAAGAGQS